MPTPPAATSDDALLRRDNLRMLGKLAVIAALMFGFGYALVPMYREAWEAKGGPVACDVHPDEVASYRRGGWRVAPVEQPPARAASDRKGGK